MAWSKSTRITVMLAIDIVFFLVELIVGLVVKSLALTADAFHMLNDIISLCVGLWAVAVARKATTDKYSYGWLRAEILGAFFNAVFLIALCVSIILEAITRFFDPPKIDNPKLILIVGSLGLASNLVGFLVLGGHGHGHSHDEHGHEEGAHDREHAHTSAHAAEEGRAEATDRVPQVTDENGLPADVLPEAVVARATAPSEPSRHIRFGRDHHSEGHGRCSSRTSGQSRGRERRRTSSLRHSRLTSIDDISIYPSSFRQEIIAASRPHIEEQDGATSESDTDDNPAAEDTDLNEETPLLKSNGANTTVGPHESPERSSSRRPRRDSSLHLEHNHNKVKKRGKKSHGHDHGDMGMNAMVLHVLGDALGNVGVIITALIIWLTDWPGRYYADPAVSLFITLIILKSAIPLTLATSKILLQATPDHIDLNEIREDIQALPGVVSCHHVHIWQLSDTKIVASMHVEVSFPISAEGGEKYMELAKRARRCLHAYGIHSATIQPEFCPDKKLARDNNNNGNDTGGLRMDGAAVNTAIVKQGDACLLECVDECIGKGCCSGTDGSVVGGSSLGSHSVHSVERDDHARH